jgi:hypothetical protein
VMWCVAVCGLHVRTLVDTVRRTCVLVGNMGELAGSQ